MLTFYLIIENCNEVWFKDICETIVSKCGSKKNCKIMVRDYGFQDIFETTVPNCGFMVIIIKKILKIILKSQY